MEQWTHQVLDNAIQWTTEVIHGDIIAIAYLFCYRFMSSGPDHYQSYVHTYVQTAAGRITVDISEKNWLVVPAGRQQERCAAAKMQTLARAQELARYHAEIDRTEELETIARNVGTRSPACVSHGEADGPPWTEERFGNTLEWVTEVPFNDDLTTTIRLWTWRFSDPVEGPAREYSAVLTTYLIINGSKRLIDETEAHEIEGLPAREPNRLNAAKGQAAAWARQQNQKHGEMVANTCAYLGV